MSETDNNIKKERGTFSIKSFLVWLVVINPITLFIAMMSTGFGHGDYFFTKIFYPYTMLSTHFSKDVITTPFCFLALIQMPIYGGIFAFAVKRRIFILFGIFVLIIHLIAIYYCLYIPMPNFS